VIVELKGHSPGLLKILPPAEGMDMSRRFGMKIVQLRALRDAPPPGVLEVPGAMLDLRVRRNPVHLTWKLRR
jgi:hypothetical protein